MALLFAVLTLSSAVIPMANAAAWFTNSPMNSSRDTHTATVLTNGKVLIVGERNNGVGPVCAVGDHNDLAEPNPFAIGEMNPSILRERAMVAATPAIQRFYETPDD